MKGRAGATSLLTVLLIGLLWGLNWPAVKFMLTEIPPLTIRAVAFPLAALVLATIAWSLDHRLRIPPGERVPLIVTGLLLVLGFNGMTSLGQVLTETSKAAIIAYMMPTMTAVLAVVFLGERLNPRVVVALLVGIAGLVVLASEDFNALKAQPLGPAIMMLAALFWALGNVALKARTWSLSPLAMAAWFFAVSAIACWPLVLVFEPPWHQEWPSTPVLWVMGYHILGPMVVCYTLWTLLLGRLPATIAAISTLTAPVVAVSFSILLLGDPPTWQKLAALTLIILSILMTLIPRADRN